MEKLELKHLAPYLPYGLKIRSSEGTTEILGYEWVYGKIIYQFDTDDDTGDFGFDDPIKPILRPLSDLTKEIEVDSEKFIPLDYLNINYEAISLKAAMDTKGNFLIWNETTLTSNYRGFEWQVMQKLFEWHVDVFGLIKEGLVIDINTL